MPPPPPPPPKAPPARGAPGVPRESLSKKVSALDYDVKKLEKADAEAGRILVHGTRAIRERGNSMSPENYVALLKKVKRGAYELSKRAKKAGMKGDEERIELIKTRIRNIGAAVEKTPSKSAKAARPLIRLREPNAKTVAKVVFEGWSSRGYESVQRARRAPSRNSVPSLSTFKTNYALQTAFAKAKDRAPSVPPFASAGGSLSALHRVTSVPMEIWEFWRSSGGFAEPGYTSFSRREPRKSSKKEANFSAAINRFGCSPATIPNPRGDENVILVQRLFVKNVSKGSPWLFFSQGKKGGKLYDRTFRSEYPEEEEVLLPPGKFTVIGAREVLDTKCAAGAGAETKLVRTFDVDVGFKPSRRKPLIGFEAYDAHDLLGRRDLLSLSKPELEVAALSLGLRFSHKTKAQLVDAIRDARSRSSKTPRPGTKEANERANALANAFLRLEMK